MRLLTFLSLIEFFTDDLFLRSLLTLLSFIENCNFVDDLCQRCLLTLLSFWAGEISLGDIEVRNRSRMHAVIHTEIENAWFRL